MKAVLKKQDIPGLVIIFIIGLGLVVLGSMKLKNAMESKRWPSTTGTITSSSLAGAIKYYPSIKYTYTVDSAAYSSDRISNMNFNTKNRSVVEEVLKKYPLNSEVKIYYNRVKPSDSLLEPGAGKGNFILLAFGILLLAIPFLAFHFMKA